MKIGIVTDIHENVEMLHAALKLAAVHHCDEIACLGDIVGYDQRFYRYSNNRSAKTCLGLIKSNCRWIVAGNHDLFAAGKFPAYSNGFEYPENWFTLDAAERKSLSRGKVWSYESEASNDLEEEDILFLKSLPEYIALPLDNIACVFSHYIFPDFTGSTTRYVERNNQINGIWEFMEHQQVKISFCGHSHNMFTGFGYKKAGSFTGAIHVIPQSSFTLGDEPVVIVLPALAGEKGRAAFSIMDMNTMKLGIITTGIV
ncbi:MAG TPA: metallophosphoesterase [Bacteroidales bacterium]|nr:metallophosphoesterase [Bacteroidales bacterium]